MTGERRVPPYLPIRGPTGPQWSNEGDQRDREEANVGVLQRFESRLEEMIAGTFARAFRSAVQPVELAAALQREVDNSSQALSRNRRLVPNSFHIELSPTDEERLSPYGKALSHELADMLQEYAEEQRYVFAGPIAIDFETDDSLPTGRFRVRSAAMASVTSESAADTRATQQADLVLEVNGRRHPLEPPGLIIGRGSEADLRINDPGISRRHVEIRVSDDPAPEVHAIDLGSTNGMTVSGMPTDRARLTDGSTITIGNTTLTLHVVRREGGGQ